MLAEARLPDATIEELRRLGHDVRLWPELAAPAGSLCAIVVDGEDGFLTGAADPRRLAYAAGW
jgi:gamma-glutamyltranspeptidase/glutathione hydrolase